MKEIEKLVSWLAFVMSIVTIVLFFIKVAPESVVNADTFISAIVALIGILVTILVGIQIYDAIEIKRKLKEIVELQSKIEITNKEVEKERFKMEEQRCMLMYHVFYNGRDREVDAFLRLHEALLYSLSTDTIKDDMKWYFDDLKNAMCWIDAETLGKCYHGNISDIIDDFMYMYKSTSALIKSHSNYYIIKDIYERYMKKFEVRLQNIKNGAIVSPTNIDEIIS